MMKMSLTCLLVLCGLVVNFQGGESRLKIQPNYNPFWVQTGGNFSASCVVDADDRKSVGWIVNADNPENLGFVVKTTDKALPNGKIRTSSLLSKDVVGLDDFAFSGNVLCRDGDDEEYVAFSIFNVMIEHPNVTVGEDIRLRCDPDVEAHVIWSRDGKVIDNSTERSVLEDGNQTLTIQNSRLQDSGMYQCKVMVEAGFDVSTGQIQMQTFIQNIPVSGKPFLREKVTSHVEILINDTLTLTCPVTAYPPPEVFWLRDDDSPVKSSNKVTFSPHGGVKDATLRISDVTKEDLGVYVCVAENSVGKMSKEFRVGLVGGASFDHAHACFWSVFIGLCVALLFVIGE